VGRGQVRRCENRRPGRWKKGAGKAREGGKKAERRLGGAGRQEADRRLPYLVGKGEIGPVGKPCHRGGGS